MVETMNWEKCYQERTGAQISSDRACLLKLAGEGCRMDRVNFKLCPGCITLGRIYDHASYWTRDGRPYSVILQPYGTNIEDLKSLTWICETLGLDFEINAQSWWCPGSTLLIEVRAPAQPEDPQSWQ